MNNDIVLVGCGNMGYAMLAGWLSQNSGLIFHVVEPIAELRERAALAGAATYAAASELASEIMPAIVIFAVKPQVMDKVAPEYKSYAGSDCTFVSVAAGVTINSLKTYLSDNTPIIRSMPNTPAAIGEGMFVSYANELVSEEAKTLTDKLLAVSGKTAWIESESLMDAVTAISGSGPAYMFHFIECLSKAGENLGLPKDLSLEMAIQTMAGAANLARQSDTPPGTLREQVTSPAGTTAAALEVFMSEDGLSPLVNEATEAARDRGVELGKV
ncbi:MAG: pyrroline-5-carboxylate reductase [Alphaproteobacteria bacterium]